MKKLFGSAWGAWVGVSVVAVGCSSDPSTATSGGGGSSTAMSSSGTGGDSSATSSSSGTGGDSSATSSSSGTGGTACVPVDDQNPCTDDLCDNGVPKSKPRAAGSPCSVGGTQCDGAGMWVTPGCTVLLGPPEVPSPSVGQDPVHVAAADLNGDGKPDLAVANHGSDNVSVLLNLGNGTFAPAVDYAVGADASSIATADLNDDGKPDLAVARDAGNNLSVLLNLGNGTFAAAVTHAVGTGASSIAAVDLNGDSKPDLVTANHDSSDVSVRLNLGNSTIQAHLDN